MNRSLIICDRVMFGSLLAMVVLLPSALALIAVCQGVMAITWVASRILLFKTSSHRDLPPAINFTAGSMLWPLLAIGLLIALTIPFSHYPALSFKKLGTRYLFQIVLMCSVMEVVRSRKRLYIVLAVMFLMLSFVAVDAMTQYVLGKGIFHRSLLVLGRVSGPMNTSNDLGTLLVTVLPMVLVSIIAFRKRMSWAGTAAVSLLFFFLAMSLGLTDSRGAWVAFVVSIIALGCFLRRRVLVLIVLLLAVFFGVFGMYYMSTRIDSHSSFANPLGLSSGHDVLKSFSNPSGRVFYWNTAIDVVKHYPWFGCGYSAYVQTLRDLHVGHEEYPHNSLLHITAELGITGLLLHIWLFVALCVQGWRVIRTVSAEKDLYLLGCGISCGILAWMIHSLMDTPWSSLQLSFLVWLMAGILLSLDAVKLDPVKKGLK